MSLDFFNEACKHPPISNEVFGLCDDNNSTKAYPDFDTEENWIAEVRNKNHLEITVTSIDKCVLNDDEFEDYERCDCMLTTEVHLYLVELKDKDKRWQEKGIEQLISTIDILLANHDISKYFKRKAFVCNKKRGRFATIENERNITLFRRTGFRIDSQAKIVVV